MADKVEITLTVESTEPGLKGSWKKPLKTTTNVKTLKTIVKNLLKLDVDRFSQYKLFIIMGSEIPEDDYTLEKANIETDGYVIYGFFQRISGNSTNFVPNNIRATPTSQTSQNAPRSPIQTQPLNQSQPNTTTYNSPPQSQPNTTTYNSPPRSKNDPLPPLPANAESWDCPDCTYTNLKMDRPSCEMCAKDNPYLSTIKSN